MNAPQDDVVERLVRLEAGTKTRPAAFRGLEVGLVPARKAQMLVDAKAGDLLEVAAEGGKAKFRVLLPIPVGAERCEASIAGFACRERSSPIPHARLERFALVFESIV